MTRNKKIWVAIVVVAAALAIGTVFAAMSPRTRVRYWTWRMHSGDLETRTRARVHLLEIGRPTIDPVYVEVVVGEITDRLTGRGARALVGVCQPQPDSVSEIYDLETTIAPRPHGSEEACRFELVVGRHTDDRAWRLLAGSTLAERRLVVLGPRGAVLEISVPKDDPLSESIIAGTESLLSAKK
ncbi:MAG TPA: hypothetical protein VFF73_22005 [Planctomycetota bacterium]|nr:hypothetical protein [Planctomycetota bacterium]